MKRCCCTTIILLLVLFILGAIVSLIYYLYLEKDKLGDEYCRRNLRERRNGFEITVNGKMTRSPNGEPFCSYLGIPYADPPINELRFELPHLLGFFDIPRNLKTKPNVCIQEEIMIEEGMTGSEDCLYLNVFTNHSTAEPSDLLPVLVWIHGGSFFVGSAFSDGANGTGYLVEQEIVVVTLNYRLGPLGFFYKDGEEIPGNLGLRDQQTALIWIQNNIQHFGGNPKLVTLVGWSAGAAAVHYHMYAPFSAGLFHRAIVMSGSFLNPWAFNQNMNECVDQLCNRLELKCQPGQIKKEMKEIDAKKIYDPKNIPATGVSYFGTIFVCFVPTIEKVTRSSRNLFLTMPPQDMIKKTPIYSDVPLMMGFTTFETENLVFYSFNSSQFNYKFPNNDETVIDSVRNLIATYYNVTTNEDGNMPKEVEFLIKLLGVADMFHGVKKFAENYAAKASSNLFLYEFSYNPKSILTDDNTGQTRTFLHKAPVHGDDLNFLFDNVLPDYEKIRETRKRMISLWTNFIKYGHPTPTLLKADIALGIEWRPFNAGGELLQIDQELKMKSYEEGTIFKTWESIYKCLYEYSCYDFYTNTVL